MPRDEGTAARLAEIRCDFQSTFGADAEGIIRVPGRVNLIGEHTDYNEGFVLPFAVDRHLYFAYDREGQTSQISLHSLRDELFARLDLNGPDLSAAKCEGWLRYPLGVLSLLRDRGCELAGGRVLVGGDLSPGAGMSSSAALCLGVLELQRSLRSLSSPRSGTLPEGLAAAQLCREVEHRFIGVPCGIMDPFAILHAEPESALFLDCRDHRYEHVPIDARHFVFELLSGLAPHRLAISDYPRRRAECDELKENHAWNSRACSEDELAHLPEPLGRRARHVGSENLRVEQFVDALRDGNRHAAGRLLFESHDSLRHDFEVSTPAHDRAVDLLRTDLGRSHGVLGARIMGGGFGGSLLILRSRRQGRRELLDQLNQEFGEVGAALGLEEVRAAGGIDHFA